MDITKSINMDLANFGATPTVDAVQNESNTRIVKISLFDNGKLWDVPSGVTAAVAFRKPDNTAGLYTKLPNGGNATTISGNTVSATLAEQVLAVDGDVKVSVVLVDRSLNQLATFPIVVRVAPNPSAGETVSDNYYNYQTLGEINAELDRINREMDDFYSNFDDVSLNIDELAKEIDAIAYPFNYCDLSTGVLGQMVDRLTGNLVTSPSNYGYVKISVEYGDTLYIYNFDSEISNVNVGFIYNADGSKQHGIGLSGSQFTVPLKADGYADVGYVYINYRADGKLAVFKEPCANPPTSPIPYGMTIRPSALSTSLKGKTMLVEGDSIAYGYGSGGYGYGELLSEKHGLSLTKTAASGSTLALVDGKGCISDRITAITTEYDYCLLEGGYNDFGNSAPLGALPTGEYPYTTDPDTTTVIGALESIFQYMIKNYPKTKLYFVTPHRVNRVWVQTNSIGLTFEDYYNAILSVCSLYSIPVIDLYKKSRMTTYFADIKTYTMNNDGLHPTSEGYEIFYLPLIENALLYGAVSSGVEESNQNSFPSSLMVRSNNIAVTANNYSEVLPDANNAESNVLYLINFPEGSTDIPANLPFDEYEGYLGSLFTIDNNSGYRSQLYFSRYKIYSRTVGDPWTQLCDGAKTEWVLSRDGDGDFTTWHSALNYLVGKDNITLRVKNGTYDLYKEKDASYWANYSVASDGFGPVLGNGIKVICEPDVNIVFNYTGTNADVLQYFSPINTGEGGFELVGGNIICSNCRYCIHEEEARFTTFSPIHIKGVYMRQDNTGNSVFSSTRAIGGGTGLKTNVLIEDCIFDTPIKNYDCPLVSYHTSVQADSRSYIVIKNNMFLERGTARFSYYGESTLITNIMFNNNSIGADVMLSAEDGATINNINVISFNNEIRSNTVVQIPNANGVKF